MPLFVRSAGPYRQGEAAAGVPEHIRAAWVRSHCGRQRGHLHPHTRPEDLVMARDALSKIYNSAV